MRHIAFWACLVALFVMVLPAVAADVTGKWDCEVVLDMGAGNPSFALEQDGENLTGTYSGMAGEAKLTGTVKGNEIQFEFETDFGPVKYAGTIEDDGSMKGTADYAGQANGTWTATKQAE